VLRVRAAADSRARGAGDRNHSRCRRPLYSYYTYLDDHLEPLFHFTKRKFRQYPYGFGAGTTTCRTGTPKWQDGASGSSRAWASRARQRRIQARPRDNQLKLIECNPRFTLVHEMLQICGIDASLLVYNRLTGRPLPAVGRYRRGVRVLLLREDYYSFKEAHAQGTLSWRGGWAACSTGSTCSIFAGAIPGRPPSTLGGSCAPSFGVCGVSSHAAIPGSLGVPLTARRTPPS